jgi:hypothetical protein
MAEFVEDVRKVVKNEERRKRFADGKPGRTWLDSFFNRHTQVVPRVASTVTLGMAQVSEGAIRGWHARAKAEIMAFEGASNIFDDPRRIWNCDESAFSLDGSKYTSVFIPKKLHTKKIACKNNCM